MVCDKSDTQADGMEVRCCDANDPATASCSATSRCITPCPFTSIYGDKGCLYCPGRDPYSAYVPCSGDETCKITNRCTTFADRERRVNEGNMLWEQESSGADYAATVSAAAAAAAAAARGGDRQKQLQVMMASGRDAAAQATSRVMRAMRGRLG
jgi:hypothetical protein